MTIFGMITTSGSRAYTAHALSSFFANTTLEKEDRFILIVNDGEFSLPADLSSFPIELVYNSLPRSFAQNANLIAGKALAARTDMMLLNNDIIFSENWLSPLKIDDAITIPFSNADVQYTLAVEGAEPYTIPMRCGLEHYLGHEREFRLICALHHERNAGVMPAIKVLCAAFFAVRVPLKILEAVGGFETEYGVGGGEDYDYCLRTWLAGFQVLCVRSSYLLHFGGRSISPEDRERQQLYIGIFEKFWGRDLRGHAFDDAPREHLSTRLEQDLQETGFRDFIVAGLGPRKSRTSIPIA